MESLPQGPGHRRGEGKAAGAQAFIPANPYLCLPQLGPDDSAQKGGEPSPGRPWARPCLLAQAAALQRNKNASTIFYFFLFLSERRRG